MTNQSPPEAPTTADSPLKIGMPVQDVQYPIVAQPHDVTLQTPVDDPIYIDPFIVYITLVSHVFTTPTPNVDPPTAPHTTAPPAAVPAVAAIPMDQ